MIVSKIMSQNPVVVTPNVTIVDAMYLMRSKKVRRLPVVENGKLLGIVTEGDLNRASASPATTLSVHELNYLLSKMQVKDIMQKHVLTIMTETTAEEAALIMVEKKIGGLVVVDDAGKVAGIVTETDIFKTFVNMMGISELSEKKTTRLTIDTPNRVGIVHDISGLFSEAGINMSSFIASVAAGGQYQMVIRAVIPNVPEMVSRIEAKGYKVSHLIQSDMSD